MSPGLRVLVHFAVPVGLFILLSVCGTRQGAHIALPLALAACAITLFAVGQLMASNSESFLLQQAKDRAYHDTYHTNGPVI